MRYILNSAVITAPGTYRYQLITLDELREWIHAGRYESTIGYEETAEALSLLTGEKIPVNRRLIEMEVGDEALVFRLTKRVQDPRRKGGLGLDFVISNSEHGLLRREK